MTCRKGAALKSIRDDKKRKRKEASVRPDQQLTIPLGELDYTRRECDEKTIGHRGYDPIGAPSLDESVDEGSIDELVDEITKREPAQIRKIAESSLRRAGISCVVCKANDPVADLEILVPLAIKTYHAALKTDRTRADVLRNTLLNAFRHEDRADELTNGSTVPERRCNKDAA